MSVQTGVDYIIIKDFRFSDMAIALQTPDNETVTGIEVRNCLFQRSTQATIIVPVWEDFVIDNNFFDNDTDSGALQNISFEGGHSGRITNNKIYAGKTSFMSKQSDVRNGTGAQSLVEKVVIANNHVSYAREEGISFDPVGNSDTTAFHEYDTVSSSTETTVTLANANWGPTGGADPNYVGLYMSFISGTLGGHLAQITQQNNATFTLDTTEGNLDLTDAIEGDGVVISSVFIKNFIGYNTATNTTYGPASILLYGASYMTLIEGNTVSKDSSSAEINIRSIESTYAKNGSVTGACGIMSNGANLIRNNTITSVAPTSSNAAIDMFLNPQSICIMGLYHRSYHNTAIDNTLVSESSTRVYGYYQDMYSNGNVDGSSNPVTETLVSSTDSIAHTVYWPYIVSTPVIGSNGTVTIVMSEACSAAGYTTGDFWVEDINENKTNLVYGSVDGNTLYFSLQSAITPEATYYLWFNSADDSIQDTDGYDMPVYGFKPITNNYVGGSVPPPIDYGKTKLREGKLR